MVCLGKSAYKTAYKTAYRVFITCGLSMRIGSPELVSAPPTGYLKRPLEGSFFVPKTLIYWCFGGSSSRKMCSPLQATEKLYRSDRE